MAKIVLTDDKVKRLKAPARGTRIEVFDALVPGFLVRISSGEKTGAVKKSLMLRARFPDSVHIAERKATTDAKRINPTRREIGTFGKILVEEGREVARHWWTLINKGIDPRTERKRQPAH